MISRALFLLYLQVDYRFAMMLTDIYNIVNGVLLLVLVVMAVKLVFKGRALDDRDFQLRRKSFIVFFTMMIVAVATSPLLFSNGELEVCSSITICVHYFASTVFMVMSAAYFGREYYKNIFIWFLILQYGLILFVLNIVCRITGFYEPMYSVSDLISPDHNFLVYGRIFLLLAMVSLWAIMIIMVVESYVHSRNTDRYKSCEYHARPRQIAEIFSVATYIVILTVSMFAYFTTSLLLHVICRALLLVALIRSNFIYDRYVKETISFENERRVFAEIFNKVNVLLASEDNNPIYKSNNNIEEIADALEVSRADLSQYIYRELNTTFAAWVCEKKLLHCADQIANTDRKISDIAFCTGYVELPAMSKAFKKRFGVTPSEYRRRQLPASGNE